MGTFLSPVALPQAKARALSARPSCHTILRAAPLRGPPTILEAIHHDYRSRVRTWSTPAFMILVLATLEAPGPPQIPRILSDRVAIFNRSYARMEQMWKSLWITDAWTAEQHGDTAHLVVSLEKIGVPHVFNKRANIPRQRLWAQIRRLRLLGSSGESGWSRSVNHALEELAYALTQAPGRLPRALWLNA